MMAVPPVPEGERPTSPAQALPTHPASSESAGMLVRIGRRPLGAASATWILVVIASAALAPLVAPHDPLEQNLESVLTGPTSGHLLGTDILGRDVLSRLLFGARITLLVVAEAIGVWLVVGLLLGLVAGYVGGWVDRLVMRLTELAYALPAIIVLLVVLAVFSNNEQMAMAVFGLISSAGLVRIVRGSTLAIKEEAYISAARVTGLSDPRIVARHVLPRLRSLIVVQTSVFAGMALVTETGLAFLGFGPQPPAPSWGGMVADASTVLQRQPWLIVPATVTIALTVLAFLLLGDAVRDAYAEDVAGLTSQNRKRARAAVPRAAVTPSRSISPRGDGDAVLSIRDLSVAFPNDGRLVNVIDRVGLDIRRGETLGLVGESGSGKSVTALSTLNALPRGARITSGVCVFEGQNLFELDDVNLGRLRGKRIGFVGQDPIVGLDPNFTVLSLLSEAVRRHTGRNRSDARLRSLELLRLVNLPDAEAVGRRHAFELSGGMAQRVAIALALAGDPGLLVADEPTTALDVRVQAEVLALLRRLQRDAGMAILLVTHDWGVVASVCHRAAVMYAGQIVEQGLVGELFARPLHPYTRGLLAANPHVAVRGAPLTVIPGAVPQPADWPLGCHFADRCPIAIGDCRVAPIELSDYDAARSARCIRIERRAELVTR
jgi:peptide/nickel transport system permease protein